MMPSMKRGKYIQAKDLRDPISVVARGNRGPMTAFIRDNCRRGNWSCHSIEYGRPITLVDIREKITGRQPRYYLFENEKDAVVFRLRFGEE